MSGIVMGIVLGMLLVCAATVVLTGVQAAYRLKRILDLGIT